VIRSRSLAAGLVAGVLTVAACKDARSNAKPPPPATVLVGTVQRRDVPLYVETVATLDGYANVDIRARVRGFLTQQLYQDGATVKEGQVLFTIDPAEYVAALQTAKANLARARAAQTHAHALLERKRALAPSGVVSRQELDDAEAQERDAEGQVEAGKAALEQADLNLSYTRIRAPLDGIAGLALVRPGNLVGQDGPTLLTTVSQVDPIRVTFPMSEIDYVRAPNQLKSLSGRDVAWARRQFVYLQNKGRTEEGGPGLELVLSDGSVYPQRGVLVAANRQVDPSTGTIQVQALFPNLARNLRPGQYGRVRVPRSADGANALVVPDRALLQVQGTYSVAVVGPDNKVQLRRVEVGPTAGPYRILRSGVNEGDRVVVEGLQKVNEGAVVNPQPAADAELSTAAAQR
jgi:membrane fusion protein (multidrug efflux system)